MSAAGGIRSLLAALAVLGLLAGWWVERGFLLLAAILGILLLQSSLCGACSGGRCAVDPDREDGAGQRPASRGKGEEEGRE